MMKENLIPLVVVVEHATIDATNRCQTLPAKNKGTMQHFYLKDAITCKMKKELKQSYL